MRLNMGYFNNFKTFRFEMLYCIVLYCIYSSSALLIKTKKSKIYMQDCNKTANAETSGLMGNPIIGLKSITSGDRFMSPRTKLKS